MGRIKNRFPIFCGLFVLLAAIVPHAAIAEQRKLLVGGFQDIVIDGDMRVNITTRKGPSGKASGDRRILDLLKLDRISDVLYIHVQQSTNGQNRIRISEPLIITLTNSNIRNITLRGNAVLSVTEMERDGVSRIHLDGGGDIKIGRIKTDKLHVAINGPGKLSFGKGSARESAVEIQGSGIYDAANLITRKFRLEQNGNAQTSANVEENATLTNSGSGNITITGSAKCFIRRAGSAIIKCPDDGKPKRF